MAYKVFDRGVQALDCTFHKEILSRTGRSTRCLQGRGLTAVMKDKFFPNYSYRHASGGPVVDSTGKPGAAKKKGRDGGLARGRQVDTEIQHWVTAGGGARKKSSKRTVVPALHPFSRAFIALTQRLRLTPVATQVVVRDENCNLATLVDVVFLNTDGRIVVVELKTGFEGYNHVSSGQMRAEFAHHTNAPANQHKVQLAFTHAMFEKTFPEFGSADGLLIRMTTEGAHVRSLTERDKLAARRAMRQGSSF